MIGQRCSRPLQTWARYPLASPLLCRNRCMATIFEVVKSGEVHTIDVNEIRNFSVIAHIDHGKSTLSDCLLQLTGNITEKDRKKGQVLDTLKVERERGITVKAQTASMIYEDSRTNKRYLINLIDTPGHIDFAYEVSRSLASCQGALLLVDSSQSIQAQTIANFEKARKLGLKMIPIITKIDLPSAQPEDAALAMEAAFKMDSSKIIFTSAKQNIGIKEVMEAVVDQIPSPEGISTDLSSPFMARIVDSWFDEHRGVVCLVQVMGGQLKEGQKITNYASVRESKDIEDKIEFSVQEVGILTPTTLRTSLLRRGQVGYVIAGMRSTRQARIGDAMFVPVEWTKNDRLVPFPGYEPAKPMLFASIFPVNSGDTDTLIANVDRLLLNDSSITVTRETSATLGSGLRCGFLGFLHMEVFNQRLQDEYGMQIVITTPSVPYRINFEDGEVKFISNIQEWPDPGQMRKFRVEEPMVRVVLITPQEYYGGMVDVIKLRRGIDLEVQHLDDNQVLLTSLIPWQEVVCDMHDQVKHGSAGYASFNYEEAGYREANLVKVDIVVNNEKCEPLSFICHSSQSMESGRSMAIKLKEVLSRQQFEIVLQAKIGAKVLARERIAPYRKDVLSRSGKTVGGGDITRKKKLLEKQKEGKRRAKMFGKVEISQEAFWAVLQR